MQVTGYSEVASNDIRGGYIFSGRPTGFVRKGRNLLFLRRTANPGTFEVAVPIYETAIRLADRRPYYPNDTSATSVRFALTQEFEAALVQFDGNDVSDIERIFDLLGKEGGIAELSRFAKTVTLPIQRDIAVALVARDQLEYEPLAISLLIDASALAWKRENAASALGEHGTKRALRYLREVASTPATTDDLKSLHVWAFEACQPLERRLTQQRNRGISCTNVQPQLLRNPHFTQVTRSQAKKKAQAGENACLQQLASKQPVTRQLPQVMARSPSAE